MAFKLLNILYREETYLNKYISAITDFLISELTKMNKHQIATHRF
jgi:hypothetical protein